MKAIVVKQFGEPSVMHLEDVPDLKPGPGQAVVEVHAAGVNPVDTYIRAGIYPKKPTPPYTPGWDGAGVVLSVGPDVSGVKPGDRVYMVGTISGAYAQQCLCDAWALFPLPAHVSFSQGAAIHISYATAFRALFHRAEAMGGETVLIHGASGGTGIAAVQLARAAGLRVIGTAGSHRGLKLVLDEGAHAAINHTAANHFEEALAATSGRGFNVIIEMLANVNLGKDLPLLAFGGRVVVVGSRANVEITPRDLMTRDLSILGMSLLNCTPQELASMHFAIIAGLENKSLSPVVGQEIPLAEAIRAHAAVMQSGAHGKIVLIP
jgi:NADPH2:quinone reductase